MKHYGLPPLVHRRFEPEWTEFMHYLYLPVRFPGTNIRLPRRLEMLRPMVDIAADFSQSDDYIYLTAERSWVQPGATQNRPGWHCDGFGTDDDTLIWASRSGTQWLDFPSSEISEDHIRSLAQFDALAAEHPDHIRQCPEGVIAQINPYVIHAAPVEVTAGMRSWAKVSVSKHLYNLEGNSHNYLFDYDWKMWSREEARNHPSFAGADFIQEDGR